MKLDMNDLWRKNNYWELTWIISGALHKVKVCLNALLVDLRDFIEYMDNSVEGWNGAKLALKWRLF